MSKRTLHTLFLAFALLFAQQGAAWHALSHVGGAPEHGQSEKKLPHGEQCTKCAAFSQLGAACASTVPAVDVLSFRAVLQSGSAAQYQHRSLSAYQSRAPPPLV